MNSNVVRLVSAWAVAGWLLAAWTGCASSAGRVDEVEPVVHEVTESDRALAASKAPLEAEEVVLYVNGMGCPLCATNIDLQLERVPGVRGVKTDLSAGTVRVTLGGAKRPSPAALGEAIEDAGFTLVKVVPR